MTTHISNEAVEAAAKAMALDQSAPNWMSEQEWDGIMPERYKEPYRRQARLALEAAAPFMAAQAWDQGARAGWNQSCEGWNSEYPEVGSGESSVDLSSNPYT